jgi:hypothetical protein
MNTSDRSPRDSDLKCCVIKGVGISTIVFRAEALDPTIPYGSWAEKTLAENVFSLTPNWTTPLNFDTRNKKLYWFHENIEKKNPRNYNIQMFAILTTQEVIPKERIIRLGQYICDNLNRDPKNTTTTSLDEQSFFWLEGKPIWSDIMGYDAALASLLLETGHTRDDGYFLRNKNKIHSYFHPGSMSVDLAMTLLAPPEEIHPSLRPSFNPSDNNDKASCDNENADSDNEE